MARTWAPGRRPHWRAHAQWVVIRVAALLLPTGLGGRGGGAGAGSTCGRRGGGRRHGTHDARPPGQSKAGCLGCCGQGSLVHGQLAAQLPAHAKLAAATCVCKAAGWRRLRPSEARPCARRPLPSTHLLCRRCWLGYLPGRQLPTRLTSAWPPAHPAAGMPWRRRCWRQRWCGLPVRAPRSAGGMHGSDQAAAGGAAGHNPRPTAGRCQPMQCAAWQGGQRWHGRGGGQCLTPGVRRGDGGLWGLAGAAKAACAHPLRQHCTL